MLEQIYYQAALAFTMFFLGHMISHQHFFVFSTEITASLPHIWAWDGSLDELMLIHFVDNVQLSLIFIVLTEILDVYVFVTTSIPIFVPITLVVMGNIFIISESRREYLQ